MSVNDSAVFCCDSERAVTSWTAPTRRRRGRPPWSSATSGKERRTWSVSVGPNRAIHRGRQAPIKSGQLNLPLDAVAVVWVYAPDDVLGGGGDRARLDAKKTKHVVRPQQDVGLEVPLPSTRLRELLRALEGRSVGAPSGGVASVRHRVRASAPASETLGSLSGAGLRRHWVHCE